VLLTRLGSIIGFYTGYPSSVCINMLAFASYVVVGGGQAARRIGGALPALTIPLAEESYP
jgi:zinc/manganese transport system permease protein